MAPTAKSPRAAAIWATIRSGSTARQAAMPRVSCAVTAVTAVRA